MKSPQCHSLKTPTTAAAAAAARSFKEYHFLPLKNIKYMAPQFLLGSECKAGNMELITAGVPSFLVFQCDGFDYSINSYYVIELHMYDVCFRKKISFK